MRLLLALTLLSLGWEAAQGGLPPTVLKGAFSSEVEVTSEGNLVALPPESFCTEGDSATTATVKVFANLTSTAGNDQGSLDKGLRVFGSGSTQQAALAGTGLAVFGSVIGSVGTAVLSVQCQDSENLTSSIFTWTLHLRGQFRTRQRHAACPHRPTFCSAPRGAVPPHRVERIRHDWLH
jgi:hypothetical protein